MLKTISRIQKGELKCQNTEINTPRRHLLQEKKYSNPLIVIPNVKMRFDNISYKMACSSPCFTFLIFISATRGQGRASAQPPPQICDFSPWLSTIACGVLTLSCPLGNFLNGAHVDIILVYEIIAFLNCHLI